LGLFEATKVLLTDIGSIETLQNGSDN